MLSVIQGEDKRWRNLERSKYSSKVEHLNKIRLEEEERMLQKCSTELEEYREFKVSNKIEMANMSEQDIEMSRIGKVELDENELAVLRLPSTFAVRRKLAS